MNPTALLLVVLSSFLHAAWNYLTKRAQDRIAFMYLIFVASPLIWLVPLVWMLTHGISIGPWYLPVAGGFFQALYIIFMARGYECGDLSQVYPLARGLGPGLIALIAWPLLGEKLSALGGLGILAIMGGGFLLHTETSGDLVNGNAWRNLCRPASRFAITAGIFISAYHIIDKAGSIRAATPFAYLCAMNCCLLLFLTPFTFRYRRWAAISAEWRRSWPWILVVTVFCFVAYFMVVLAMRLAPVAYVAALRNISILLGVGLGLVMLKEQGARWRLAGASLMLAGITAIALGG
jgi:drug/metabolite transporter (DMT)-like permease